MNEIGPQSSTSSTDSSTTNDVAGTVAVEAQNDSQTSALDQMSIQDLIDLDFSDDPKLADIMSQEHKGLPAYKEILLKHTTSEGRKLIANLRTSYARQQNELHQAKQNLEQEKRAVQLEKEALYNGDFAKNIRTVASQDGTKLDPYDQADLAKIIEIETAKRLQDMLKPMQTQMVEQQQIYEAERFIAQHPEMKTEAFKAKLIPLITEKPELEIETAFWIIKGQLANDDKVLADKAREQGKLKTQAQRDAFNKTASTSNVSATKAPKGLTPYEASKWFAAQKK
jgi:hypothetical protein